MSFILWRALRVWLVSYSVMGSKILASTVILIGLSNVLAQVCEDELLGIYSDEVLQAQATGVFAVNVLTRALEMVEPALPPFVFNQSLKFDEADPQYREAVFIEKRNLLPKDWDMGVIDTASWQEMITSFVGWYGVADVTVGQPLTNADLVSDLSLALESVAKAVRPLAVISTLSHDSTIVRFLALIWNWTIYPRLIVFRPPEDITLDATSESIVQRLETCAIKVKDWILATEDIARDLFLSQDRTKMYIVSGIPGRQDYLPQLVDAGDEMRVFSFDAPEVSNLEAYSAVFVGPKLDILTLMKLLPHLHISFVPHRIFYYLLTPKD